MADIPFDTSGLTPLPDAGKRTFSELLYARKFLRKLALRTHEKSWYVFNGRCWELQKRAHFESLAYKILPEEFRLAKNAKSVLEAAQMQQQLTLGQNFSGAIRWDGPGAVLINCYNGVLRVTDEDTKLTKHDPELLFTGCILASWSTEANAPELFHKVLNEVLPESADKALLQWFGGYLLFPSNRHEVFLISHGGGGSGKSTISDAMMEVIGGKPCRTVLSMAQICAEGQGAYSLPSLQYALVNMGTELDTVAIGDSANFKRVVSGEPIEVRPIYGEPHSMTNYTVKLWFNSNSLPRFRHGTDAELRRARFLEFVHPPKVKDVTIKERLAGERDGIFQWMVAGLQCILGGADCPEGSAESRGVKDKFAISNDPVTAFAKECLHFAPDLECKKESVWDAFGEFLGSWGFNHRSRESLFRQFYERFPQVSAFRQQEASSKREAGQYLRGVTVIEQEGEE